MKTFFSVLVGLLMLPMMAQAQPVPAQKAMRVGMSWEVKEVWQRKPNAKQESYTHYKVLGVGNNTVTVQRTMLSPDKQELTAHKRMPYTFPQVKNTELTPGTNEVIKVGDREFPCRRIVGNNGRTTWVSLEYPMITVRERLAKTERDLVAFQP